MSKICSVKFTLKAKLSQVDSPQECEHGEVRLVGGVTNSTGRLEFCARGVWGRVCNYHDYWGPDNTRVVCRQLGFSDNGTIQFSCMFKLLLIFSADSYYTFTYDSRRYGTSESLVVIGEVYCTGSESELLECSHASIGRHHCFSDTDSLYDGDILLGCY